MRSTVVSRIFPVILVLFAVVLHARLALSPGGALFQNSLADTDSYARLLRVIQLWQGGGWFDGTIPGLGAPEGMPLHWTRPLDVLIIGPAYLMHLIGMAETAALWWSALLICPVLHILSCLATIWAARALWPREAAWFAALILLGQVMVLTYGAVGRADHHVLILLACILSIGAFLRAVQDPGRHGMAFAAGAYGAFGLWIGPEALITFVPALASLGLLFVVGRAAGPALARQGLRAALGFAAVVVVAIAAEVPPANYLVVQSDRISCLHLALGFAMAAVFTACLAVEGRFAQGGRNDWRRRLFVGGFASVLALVLLSLAFPGFYRSSLDIDDPVMNRVLGQIVEMQPIRFWTFDGFVDLLRDIGGILFGIAVIPVALWRERDPGRRAAIFLLALTAGASLAAGIVFQRFIIEYAAVGPVLTAGLLVYGGALLNRVRPLPRLAGFLAIALGATILLPAIGTEIARRDPLDSGPTCDRHLLADWLVARHPGPTDARDPIVMIDNIDLAPGLAYETPYRFVGAPYHRGIGPMRDTVEFFAARSNAAAAKILARRQVSLVVLCRPVQGLRANGTGTIGARLMSGEGGPDFLEALPLSGEMARQYAIFLFHESLETGR